MQKYTHTNHILQTGFKCNISCTYHVDNRSIDSSEFFHVLPIIRQKKISKNVSFILLIQEFSFLFGLLHADDDFRMSIGA